MSERRGGARDDRSSGSPDRSRAGIRTVVGTARIRGRHRRRACPTASCHAVWPGLGHGTPSKAGDQSTIDANDGSREIGRPLARQEGDGIGIFLRAAVAAEWNGGGAFLCDGVDAAAFALGFCSSRNRIRSVAMRPGRMMFAVIPCWPTSRASVFDQPTSERRRAFEMPRFGIGETTPDDVLVMMRPHLRSRMPGRTRSVSAITDRTWPGNASPKARTAGRRPGCAAGRRCC